MSPSLTRLTMFTWGALALRLGTQAAMLTFAAHYLGPANYGRVAAATSIAAVLGVITNLGASMTVIAQSGRDAERVGDVWRFAWPQHALLGPVIAALYVAIASWGWNAGLSPWTISFIAMSEIVLMPLALQISAMLQAIDRVPLSQMLQWCILSLRVAALAACLAIIGSGGSVDAYAFGQMSATSVGLVIASVVASRYVSLRGQPRLPTRNELSNGLLYCATSGVGAASMEIDKVAAFNATNAFDAGVYSTMSRVVFAGTIPIVGMMLSAQPRLFSHAGSGGEALRRLVRKIAWTALALGMLGSVGLIVGEPILRALFGVRFQSLAKLTPIMAMAIPAMSLRLAGTNVMLSLGRPSRRVAIDIAGIVLLVVSMTILGRLFGLTGLGVALVVSETCLAVAAWLIVLNALRSSPLESTEPS